MSSMCRLCLKQGPDLVHMMEFKLHSRGNTESLTFDQLIQRYLSIEVVRRESPLHMMICMTCCKRIEDWHLFRESCLENDSVFHEYMTPAEVDYIDERLQRSLALQRTEKWQIVLLKDENEVRIGTPQDEDGDNDDDCTTEEYGKYECIEAEESVDDAAENCASDTEEKVNLLEIVPKPSRIVEAVEDDKKFKESGSDYPASVGARIRPGRKNTRLPAVVEIRQDRRAGICSICGESRRNMAEHMRMHNNERRFQCPHCPKTFISASNYNGHVNIHTREKMYKCDLCDKEYAMLNGLKQHRATHAKNRVYLCPICGKSYYQQTGLARHKRTHLEEPKISCTACDKKFLTNCDLRKHFVKHLNIKPFSCEICKRAFNRKDNLQTHLKTHRKSSASRASMEKD